MAIVARYLLNGNSNDAVSGYNGTDTSMTYVPGVQDTCANFSGSGYINIGNGLYSAINGDDSYWFYFSINPSTLTWGAVIYSYVGGGDFYLYYDPTGFLRVRRWWTFNDTSTGIIITGKWQRFCIKYQGASCDVYKDGKFIANLWLAATPVATTNFRIGSYNDWSFKPTAKIDNFIVQDTTPTIAQIKNDYALMAWFFI